MKQSNMECGTDFRNILLCRNWKFKKKFLVCLHWMKLNIEIIEKTVVKGFFEFIN